MFWVIFACVIVAIILLMQILVRLEIIDAKFKIWLGVALLLIGVGIGVFNFYQEKGDKELTYLAQKFLEGSVLVCIDKDKEIQADNKKFNFISGTMTLVDKEKNIQTLSLKRCKIKE
ncbi:hypothetical protein B6S12_06810 [Helicobacter valdiviensis]|uniref:Uncharacterized protein n=1 Tax=Helicobacter valdiviensis TaxID=1458358 RepID=A0A2W6MXG1_9HELI|nr:hypothetical protein [Helicobacter valdiviensis]PZT47868.1 hypothetical protein B6S12_06810 [Helicobacter valdiviensis]